MWCHSQKASRDFLTQACGSDGEDEQDSPFLPDDFQEKSEAIEAFLRTKSFDLIQTPTFQEPEPQRTPRKMILDSLPDPFFSPKKRKADGWDRFLFEKPNLVSPPRKFVFVSNRNEKPSRKNNESQESEIHDFSDPEPCPITKKLSFKVEKFVIQPRNKFRFQKITSLEERIYQNVAYGPPKVDPQWILRISNVQNLGILLFEGTAEKSPFRVDCPICCFLNIYAECDVENIKPNSLVAVLTELRPWGTDDICFLLAEDITLLE